MFQLDTKEKTAKIALALALVALIGLCILAYFNRSTIMGFRQLFSKNTEISAKTLMKIKFDPKEVLSVTTFDSKVLLISKTGIKAVNMSNIAEWEIKYDIANPLVKVNGKYILIGDQGGKNVFLYQGNKKLWNKTLDGAIINAKLNKNGYVLLHKQLEGTNDELLGFNVKGQTILRKSYTGQEYLINADVSSDNKKVVTLSAFTNKSTIASKVEFFQLKSTVEVNSVPVSAAYKENALSSDIKIFDNGDAVMVTDSMIYGLDGAGKDKWQKDISTIKVGKVDLSSGNYVIIESNGPIKNNFFESKKHIIEVIGPDGKIEGEELKLADSVSGINTFNSYFLVSDSVNLYSVVKGKYIWSYPLRIDIKYIKGFEGKSQILLVARDSAEVIEAN